MDFDLSDEQEQLRSEVERFAENGVRPVAKEYDVAEEYPWEVIDDAAEMGLLGAQIPFEYGGGGYDTLDLCLVTEELFAADPGIGLCLTSTAFGSEAITEFGTEAQEEEYRPPIAEGEAIMDAAISEPDTGSDVSSVSTRAEKDGGEWVINGNEMWITNGSVGTSSSCSAGPIRTSRGGTTASRRSSSRPTATASNPRRSPASSASGPRTPPS